jgi:hypothetical protein
MSLYRVYCINDKCTYAPPVADWKIKEGETYEVLSEFVPYPKWGIYLELDLQPGVGYPVEYFVRLPEATADEMADEKHEAIIYQR